MKVKFKLKAFLVPLLALTLVLPARATETVTLPEDEQAQSAFIAAEEQRTRPAALVSDSDISVTARSALLMDKATGTVIYGKNETQAQPLASVTKIMTLLLTVEQLEQGIITKDTVIECSDYASSMGGSQIYLAPGEKMTVHELLKSVAVASANDASVALAEYIAGSEEQFVRKMNERAKELGMTNTEFYNCTGLPATPSNRASAQDVAIMSRALLSHDMIYEYTTIWMDSVRNGSFGLANTNKLIYYYDGATGLKTGFTQEAGFCVSASAKRDESEFIAVVLGEESSDARWKSARAMLDYAFANYCTVKITARQALPPIAVKLGKLDYVPIEMSAQPWLLLPKSQANKIETQLNLQSFVEAPVMRGTVVGTLIVSSQGETLAELPLVACQDVDRLSYGEIFVNFLRILCFG